VTSSQAIDLALLLAIAASVMIERWFLLAHETREDRKANDRENREIARNDSLLSEFKATKAVMVTVYGLETEIRRELRTLGAKVEKMEERTAVLEQGRRGG
jgi:hypothetical protein